MLFCAGTAYAIRVLSAMRTDEGFAQARDLAERTGLPSPYLSKVLHHLAEAGLLESARGPRGGYRLLASTERITVGEVVAILNRMKLDACILGFEECPKGRRDCPLDRAWCEAKAHLDENLAHVTIQDMARRGSEGLQVLPRVRPEGGCCG
ncbi:MAG TPA: Rrf2 family transcriptional regulator [Holophaga sp.]|nr:Rrf2 family transcriptional regulator [Holophaga sp.]